MQNESAASPMRIEASRALSLAVGAAGRLAELICGFSQWRTPAGRAHDLPAGIPELTSRAGEVARHEAPTTTTTTETVDCTREPLAGILFGVAVESS
jgi:hypothetical protein